MERWGDRLTVVLACALAFGGCGSGSSQADGGLGGSGGAAGRIGGGTTGTGGVQSPGSGGVQANGGTTGTPGAPGSGGAMAGPGGAAGVKGSGGASACAGETNRCAGTMSGPWCVDKFLPTDTMSPTFTGLWSTGPSNVWAVGTRQSAVSSSQNGFVFHWDGCSWTQSPVSTTAGLNDVWGASAGDIWIVGTGGTALHWNGSAWSPVPTGTTESLTNVSGSGAADVWAIGLAGVIHWNGSVWAPSPGGTTANPQNDGFIGDIWAVAPNDVWVAQGTNLPGTVSHFDGTTWTPTMVVPQSPFQVFGIWAASGIAWAVGEGSDTYQFDNGVWMQIGPSGGSAEGLLNVMAVGGDIWAVGQTVTHSSDGVMFSRDNDAPSGFYTGLWVTGTQVWVGGDANGAAGSGAVVLHRAR